LPQLRFSLPPWEKVEALGLDSKRGAAMSHHQHLASALLYLGPAVVPVLGIAAAYLLGQQLRFSTQARFRPFALFSRLENRKVVSSCCRIYAYESHGWEKRQLASTTGGRP
jgi:hypothetical protein